MKKYNNKIISKFLNFSLKQKINFFVSVIGLKKIIYFILFNFLSFFLNSNSPFINRVIFNIYKKKNDYLLKENSKGEKFLLFSYDKTISQEVFSNNEFDLAKLYKVLEILKDDFKINNIFDIGANIGTICIPAIKRGLVQTAVAIEPEIENFKLLKLNIALNSLEKKISIYNTALSSSDDDKLILEKSRDNSGDHRIRTNKEDGIYNELERDTIAVHSKTFDSLFPKINPTHDLVWMDTQGFEAKILLGSKNLILSGAPIVIEFWPYGLKRTKSLGEMKKIMNDFKFYYDLSEDNPKKNIINNESINLLFDGWDDEKNSQSQHSLHTDILLLS
jgi:FkbM family methyltransferase